MVHFPVITEEECLDFECVDTLNVSGACVLSVDSVSHDIVKVPIENVVSIENDKFVEITTNRIDTIKVGVGSGVPSINVDTWNIDMVDPLSDSVLIPKIVNVGIEHVYSSIELRTGLVSFNGVDCVQEMVLSKDIGWMLGAIIGDGWVTISDTHNGIHLSTTYEEVGAKFLSVVDSLLEKDISNVVKEHRHMWNDVECFSKDYAKCNKALSYNIAPLVGSGAKNKHLPYFFMHSPLEFRVGLLSGLIDTDGSIAKDSRRNNSYSIEYTTTSERLASEVQLLCRSLGVYTKVGISNRNNGGLRVYRVYLSVKNVAALGFELYNNKKMRLYSEIEALEFTDNATSARNDLVPFSESILRQARTFVSKKTYGAGVNSLSNAKRNACRYISRSTAKRIVDIDVDNILDSRWVDIVNNESITWVYPKSIEVVCESFNAQVVGVEGANGIMAYNGITV